MSAYLVSNETMQRSCEAVLIAEDSSREAYYLEFDAVQVTALGRLLYAMNDRALASRYNDEPSGEADTYEGNAFVADTDKMFSDAMMQRYKSVRCLLYQCSEGDVPEEELYKRLAAAAARIAIKMVEASPLYESAEWA